MFRIFVYFLIIFVGIGATKPKGCKPTSKGDKGFEARFYSLNTPVVSHHEFYRYDYKKSSLMKFIPSVRKANFKSSSVVYGYRLPSSNFVIELTGWFFAQTSGGYTFSFSANSGASLQIGSGFTCCMDGSGITTGAFELNGHGSNSGYYRLKNDVYYPVKVVMYSWNSSPSLTMEVTDPKGRRIKDVALNVFQAKFNKDRCYSERPLPPIQRPIPPIVKPIPPVEKPIPPVEKPIPPVEKPNPPIQKPIPPVEKPNPPIQKPNPPIQKPNPPIQKPKPPVEKPKPPVEKPKPPVEKPIPPTAKPKPPIQIPTPSSKSTLQKPPVSVTKPTQASSVIDTWTGSYTTTFTTTPDDGNVATESGVVDRTTDSQGSTYTWTSLFPKKTSSSVDAKPSVTDTWTGSYTTTFTTTPDDGNVATESGVVDRTTDSQGSTYTWTSLFPKKTSSSVDAKPSVTDTWTGSYTTTFTTTPDDGNVATESGVVDRTTDSQGSTYTWTSLFPKKTSSSVDAKPSVTDTWTGSYTTTFTTTPDDGNVATESGVVDRTTDSQGSTYTWTSLFPKKTSSSVDAKPSVTDTWTGSYTTTFTTTPDDGNVATESGVVDRTTDSQGSTYTWTSLFPKKTSSSVDAKPSVTDTWTGSYTTTFTTTPDDGNVATESGVVDRTTDSQGSTYTWTSLFPKKTSSSVDAKPSVTDTWTGSYTTTFTTTPDDGNVATESGVVDRTTDSQGSTYTWTSLFPKKTSSSVVAKPSVTDTWTGSYTTTFTTTPDDGNVATESGVVDRTTDSQGSTYTWTSLFPKKTSSSVDAKPSVTDTWTGSYTTTFTTTPDDGNVATESGVVDRTTDSQGSTYTWTSLFPKKTSSSVDAKPSVTDTWTGSYTTTFTTTPDDGNVATESGVVDRTTDSHGSTYTWTSLFPKKTSSSVDAKPSVTDTWTGSYTTTFTTTPDDGNVATESGVVDRTTDSQGSTYTWTSLFPKKTSSSVDAKPSVTDTWTGSYTTTFTTTPDDGNVATESGVVDRTTDSQGSTYTWTSLFPKKTSSSVVAKPSVTDTWTGSYTTTFTTTPDDGNVATESGVVDRTTDSHGSTYTWTSLFPQVSSTSTGSQDGADLTSVSKPVTTVEPSTIISSGHSAETKSCDGDDNIGSGNSNDGSGNSNDGSGNANGGSGSSNDGSGNGNGNANDESGVGSGNGNAGSGSGSGSGSGNGNGGSSNANDGSGSGSGNSNGGSGNANGGSGNSNGGSGNTNDGSGIGSGHSNDGSVISSGNSNEGPGNANEGSGGGYNDGSQNVIGGSGSSNDGSEKTIESGNGSEEDIPTIDYSSSASTVGMNILVALVSILCLAA